MEPTSLEPVEQEPFVCSDLYVAAYCLTHGHKVTLVPVSPSKVKFVFAPQAEIDAAGFYRGESVPARLYANSLRDLKSLMNSGRGA